MNPRKFFLGVLFIFAFFLASPVRAQIAGFGNSGLNWTLNEATNSTDAPDITNSVLYMGTNSDDSMSAYYDTVQYIGNFTASFVFRNILPTDDAGFAFVLQNDAVTAVGTVVNNNLGYVGVTEATGIAFDIDPQGNGPGIGYAPIAIPAGGPNGYIQTGAVNFRGVNPIAVNILYTNDVLNVTVTDTVTRATFTTNFVANLATAVGANTAYVGFSAGGTGSLNITISNFVFNSVQPSGSPLSGQVGLASRGAIQDVSMLTGNESDPVITLDPGQPNEMFTVANTNASFNPGLFSKYSTNSGTNWLVGSLTNIPAGYNPAVAWDAYGNLFLAYADTVNLGTDIAISTNGGQSFNLLTNLATSHFTAETRIAVGSGSAVGSVWVLYHDYSISSSPLVAQGAAVLAFNSVGTFGAPELVKGATNNCGFGDIAVGSAGQVMVAYQNNISATGRANIYVSVDADGLGPNGFGAASLATASGIGGNTHIPAAPDALGLNSSTGLAWDTNPADQHYGRAYLVYTGVGSPTPNDLEIFMIYSDNNGASWSAQTQVNNDFTTHSKFMPRLSLDPTDGAVAVAWYDCRNDNGYVITMKTNVSMTNIVTTDTNTGIMMTNMATMTNVISLTNTAGTVDTVMNDDAELFVAVTLDGGVSFTPNLAMSTNPSESFLALNFEETSDYGDYNGLVYYNLTLFPVWADNSADFSSPTNPDGPTNKFDIGFGAATFTGTANSTGVTGLYVTTTLTNTPNPLLLGSTIQYLITVSNSGPASSPATTLTDTLSSYLVGIKGIPSTNNDTLVGDVLSWPVGTLAPGGAASILIHGVVSSLGNITNTAVVASTKVVNIFTNNSAFTLVTPDVSPDLAVTVTGSVPIISLGAPQVTYTMVITNLQSNNAPNVTLSDIFPTNVLTLRGYTMPPGTVLGINQTNYTFQLGTLTNGQSFTVTMTGVGQVQGLATNIATVSDLYADPVLSNNVGSAVTQISSNYVPPIFTLGITETPTNIGGNQQVVYTFGVTNVGTVNSTNVVVTNNLSTNLVYFASSISNISTNLNLNYELFALGPLATNQSTNFTVTAVGAAVGQAVSTVIAEDTLLEGPVTNQIVTQVVPPVFALSLTGSPSLIAVGQTLTNFLNITNIGIVPAYALTISNTLPTNLALQGVSVLGVSGNITTNTNSYECIVPELDPGQVTTVVFTSVGLSVGNATNTVTVFANFSTNYLPTLVTPIDAPNMALTMTGSPTTLPIGQPVTYTLTVQDLGPVPAYGIVVTDTLPSGVSFASATASQGTFSNLLNVVYFNVGPMVTNQTVTLHVTATAQTVGKGTNTGFVAANSLPDPVPGNNLATVTTTITNAPLPYNLVVVKGVTSAFITWNTPYPATDQVFYGLTTSYGSYSYLNTNLTTRHVVLLTGLQTDTNYSFQARSVTSGLLATTNGSFATVSSLTLGTADGFYTGQWTEDTAATSIYPTNVAGSDYYYTGGVSGNPTATATYVPNIPTAGFYDVYIWYPGRATVSSNTPVIITGTTNAVFTNVNQRVNTGGWQLVAPLVYYTNGVGGSAVIENNSGDPTTVVLANAVRWSYNLGQDAPTNGAVPAWWANFYFGGGVSGSVDADGDGYSNYAEYVLGTDPTSAASALQFAATSGPGKGTNTVTFGPYLGGRNYQLLSNTNAAASTGWQTLTNTPAVTTNGIGVFTVPAPTNTAVFYQLSITLGTQ
jgi:uncharacterized repeat protein (TIGR01451 family)